MASSRHGNVPQIDVTVDVNNQVKTRRPALLPSITPPISIANTAANDRQASTPLSVQPTPVNGDNGDNKRRGRPIVRSALHELVVSSGSSASSSRSPSPMQLIGKAPSTAMVSEKIIVGVRVRPFITEDNRHIDADNKQIAVSMKTNGDITQVEIKAKPRSFVFQFDHGFTCFNDGAFIDCKQESVYGRLVQPLVASTVAGFNCSFFAYGQTGTGKTFSTFGTKDEPGVLPRFCEELLEQVRASNAEETWKLEVSYLEVYNEIIIDLLNGKNQRHKLRVREHPEDGPFVENLIHETVTNEEEITTLLSTGNLARHKAATLRNDTSSRSHAVFSLTLIQMKNADGRPVLRKSKASFVDLAGSERFDSMSVSAPNATRLAEMRKINKSLTHLALVILQLADGKRTHISYRDSVLTWLLKDSLGGNAKTVMLATVAPSLSDVDETLSTLRYAATAYKVYNEMHVNEDPAMGLIEQLKTENEELKAILSKRDDTARVAFYEDHAVALNARVKELVQEMQDKELQRFTAKDEELHQVKLALDSAKTQCARFEEQLNRKMIGALKDESYEKELQCQTRLAQVYKEAADKAECKVEELTSSLESAQQLLNDAKEQHFTVQEQMKQMRIDFEEKLTKKDNTISELRDELEKANELLRSKHRVMLTTTDEEVANLSPPAASASKLQGKYETGERRLSQAPPQSAPDPTASGRSTPPRGRENAGPSGGKRVAARKPVTRQTPVAATPKPPPAEKEKASGKKRTPLPRRAAAAAASAFRVDDGSEEDDQPSTSKSGKKKTPSRNIQRPEVCPLCTVGSSVRWREFEHVVYCNACEHWLKRQKDKKEKPAKK